MNKWLMGLFSADEVRKGGIVRRRVRDVNKCSSLKDLKKEVGRRGFHLFRTGNQYIVVCNKGDLRFYL